MKWEVSQHIHSHSIPQSSIQNQREVGPSSSINLRGRKVNLAKRNKITKRHKSTLLRRRRSRAVPVVVSDKKNLILGQKSEGPPPRYN